MIPFLALVRKDLKLFFNDRKAVVVGLLVPIVLASFFGYMFGGQSGKAETSKVPVLVIDQDGSDIYRGLITQLGPRWTPRVRPFARARRPSRLSSPKISARMPDTRCSQAKTNLNSVCSTTLPTTWNSAW
jgi:ABC-2 type transport system permease protein